MTETPDLRHRIAAAIRAAAYDCDGDCGMSEEECRDAHLVQVASYSHGVVEAIWGTSEALADAVLAVVQSEIDALRAEQDRLAAAVQRVLDFCDQDQDGICCSHVTGEVRRLAALDDPAEPAAPKQCSAGQNAEDCPAGAHPNLPYPWICPGPPTATTRTPEQAKYLALLELEGVRRRAQGTAAPADPEDDQPAECKTCGQPWHKRHQCPAAPVLSTAEAARHAQAGVDTPGCDCGHDGLGEAWHANDCAWRRPAATAEEPQGDPAAELADLDHALGIHQDYPQEESQQ